MTISRFVVEEGALVVLVSFLPLTDKARIGIHRLRYEDDEMFSVDLNHDPELDYLSLKEAKLLTDQIRSRLTEKERETYKQVQHIKQLRADSWAVYDRRTPQELRDEVVRLRAAYNECSQDRNALSDQVDDLQYHNDELERVLQEKNDLLAETAQTIRDIAVRMRGSK